MNPVDLAIAISVGLACLALCLVIGIYVQAASKKNRAFAAMADYQLEQQRSRPAKREEIMRELASEGWVICKPTELAHYCHKFGYVVIEPQRYAVLVQAIMARTNHTAEVEGMLRRAGLVE